MDVSFPETEINWLHGLPEKYRVPTETYNIYPVDLLPPSLAKWVRENYRDTEFLNMGPSMGSSQGMYWAIWGWNSRPRESGIADTDWRHTILAKST